MFKFNSKENQSASSEKAPETVAEKVERVERLYHRLEMYKKSLNHLKDEYLKGSEKVDEIKDLVTELLGGEKHDELAELNFSAEIIETAQSIEKLIETPDQNGYRGNIETLVSKLTGLLGRYLFDYSRNNKLSKSEN
jgi:hypothetical protein